MKTENNYTVYFNDGTSFNSSGDAEIYMDVDENLIDKEFDWASYHIRSEVKKKGKEIKDIKRITYELDIVDS